MNVKTSNQVEMKTDDNYTLWFNLFVHISFRIIIIFKFCDQIDGARKLDTWSCLFGSSLGSKELQFLTGNPRH